MSLSLRGARGRLCKSQAGGRGGRQLPMAGRGGFGEPSPGCAKALGPPTQSVSMSSPRPVWPLYLCPGSETGSGLVPSPRWSHKSSIPKVHRPRLRKKGAASQASGCGSWTLALGPQGGVYLGRCLYSGLSFPLSGVGGNPRCSLRPRLSKPLGDFQIPLCRVPSESPCPCHTRPPPCWDHGPTSQAQMFGLLYFLFYFTQGLTM